MKKIVVVLGSTRPGRSVEGVSSLLQAQLKNYPDFDITIADLKELALPFYDNALSPNADDFAPTHESVHTWTKLVSEADAVVLITPEYNASIPGVLKNAIDWIGAPWTNKPVALVGYGWSSAASALSHLTDIMMRLKAVVIEPHISLAFTKDIGTDGSALGDTAAPKITATLDAIKNSLGA